MSGAQIKLRDGTTKLVRHLCDTAYVIQAVGAGSVVKVGRSGDPYRRISGLSSGVPFDVRIVAVLSDGARRERDLKQALAATKIRGEWFTPTSKINDLLVEAREQNAILQRRVVDEKYYKEFVEPIALEYLDGREPAQSYGGDLIYRMLREGHKVFHGRRSDVMNALLGMLSPEVAHGFVPITADIATPQIDLIEDAVVTSEAAGAAA